MIKVKTLTSPLKIFHTMEELENLDEQVNKFIKENDITKIISVNYTNTTNNSRVTIGTIPVVVYQEPE